MNRIIAAFQNSLLGLARAARTETAVRQELILLALSIPLAFWISASGWTRLALIGLVALTLVVEVLNTAIEKLCDHVTPERHPVIGYIKDLGSLAVLIMLCITAAGWALALWQRFW